MITSINLPTQEVQYASILHAQKLHYVHPVNTTGRDCLVLVQVDLADTYF